MNDYVNLIINSIELEIFIFLVLIQYFSIIVLINKQYIYNKYTIITTNYAKAISLPAGYNPKNKWILILILLGCTTTFLLNSKLIYKLEYLHNFSIFNLIIIFSLLYMSYLLFNLVIRIINLIKSISFFMESNNNNISKYYYIINIIYFIITSWVIYNLSNSLILIDYLFLDIIVYLNVISLYISILYIFTIWDNKFVINENIKFNYLTVFFLINIFICFVVSFWVILPKLINYIIDNTLNTVYCQPDFNGEAPKLDNKNLQINQNEQINNTNDRNNSNQQNNINSQDHTKPNSNNNENSQRNINNQNQMNNQIKKNP